AVKLSDFGLATQAKRCKDFGCGSRHYMAPEALADGAAATAGGHYHPAAADVWSLGVILINILTGKNLWLSPDPSDPHFAAWAATGSLSHLHEQFGFSYDLVNLLEGCFCLRPEKRVTLRELRKA
ncbi:Pkinase-domain-containing protein, partial [Caulochytrium protostelioides]